jgi:Glycosyl transferase family 2
MRVCIFMTDLGTIVSGRDALLQQITELTGERTFQKVCFVGCRQSQPLERGIAAYQPYCDAESSSSARIANALFRLVDANLAPISTARVGLSLCAPRLVEAILACDPDVVLLDVKWGGYLKTVLETEFPGEVYVTGGRQPRRRAEPQLRRLDPSAIVSIVLPTHNGSKYIRQSIQSCLDQSHRNLELIVVDDGSTEDLRSVMSEFTDPRLRYVRHEKNRGISAALNTGFTLASGEYLTWTSDDNYYAPDAIERLTRFLQNYPRIDFVYASSYIVDEMGLRETLRVQRVQPPQDLKRQNGVGACFLYTRRVYLDIGDYNSDAFLVEDYDYWVRLSKRYRMQRIFSPLYYYRYHKDSLTFRYGPDDVAQRFDVVKQQNGVA